MAATSRVYTLRQAARMLGETEDAVSEASIGMFAEDGYIHIIDENFTEDDWPLASAFTDEGLENLQYILDETRRYRS
jgi:hypothetical protein